MNQKCPKLEKLRVKLKTLQLQFSHLADWIGSAGLPIRVSGTTERSFRKTKLLEFEQGEEINAPIVFDDDNNYDNPDLLCEEDDEEGYKFCSSCDENPFGHLVQPAAQTICIKFFKKSNSQLYGCRIANNITIDLDIFNWYFHVFQCFNLNDAPFYLSLNLTHLVIFCRILPFLCSRHLNNFIDLDKYQEVVDFGLLFCFSRKLTCPIVDHLVQ